MPSPARGWRVLTPAETIGRRPRFDRTAFDLPHVAGSARQHPQIAHERLDLGLRQLEPEPRHPRLSVAGPALADEVYQVAIAEARHLGAGEVAGAEEEEAGPPRPAAPVPAVTRRAVRPEQRATRLPAPRRRRGRAQEQDGEGGGQRQRGGPEPPGEDAAAPHARRRRRETVEVPLPVVTRWPARSGSRRSGAARGRGSAAPAPSAAPVRSAPRAPPAGSD